ncbi:MAG: hypothetical protein C5B51_14790 [Terriglobia bacterium]|nr:MAG: hypothetical protein C5B51_14790 [Terriglobia bacterium]
MSRARITPEAINMRLREHAVSLADWDHREAAAFFHEWAERFNFEFKLDLPTPVIRIDRTSHFHLGAYRPDRNGFGLAHEITMNALYLAKPLYDQLATLLHEELHAWQCLYNKSGRNNYHNIAFRRKAALYGLVIDERGRHRAILPGRFTQLLDAYGIDLPLLADAAEQPLVAAVIRLPGESKLRKYRCGCTNVRCAVELVAQCLKCGVNFEEAPPAW